MLWWNAVNTLIGVLALFGVYYGWKQVRLILENQQQLKQREAEDNEWAGKFTRAVQHLGNLVPRIFSDGTGYQIMGFVLQDRDAEVLKTRRNIHAILVTMFNYAAETLELMPKSPVKRGLAPKVERREKPSLTPEQAWQLWDALVDAATIDYRAFYGVLLFTGIRTSEALGLKWEDLDFASRQITVRRAIVRGKETMPKTKASLRTRPMSPELYTSLLNHKAMSDYTQPSDYVFVSSSGRAANPDLLRGTLQSVLRDKLKVAFGPREAGLHLLRHTSGSLVFQRTGSVKEAQSWLGHSSSRITMDTYIHLMKESQQGTAELVFARPASPAVTPKGQEN